MSLTLVERLEEKAAFLNADCDCGTCQQCLDGRLLCEAANCIVRMRGRCWELVDALENRTAACAKIADDAARDYAEEGGCEAEALACREIADEIRGIEGLDAPASVTGTGTAETPTAAQGRSPARTAAKPRRPTSTSIPIPNNQEQEPE